MRNMKSGSATVRLTLRLPTPLYLELLVELKKRGYGSLNGLIVERLKSAHARPRIVTKGKVK